MNHAKLLLEPWCMTPAQVARLTPEQVDELYLKPATRLAEQMRADGKDDEVIDPFTSDTFEEFANKIRGLSPNISDERVEELWRQHQAGE